LSLRIEALTHTFKSPSAEARTVLHIERWAVEADQQVLLRGVSGSGKTTLFNILAGLLHPTNGAVYYDGQSLYAWPEAARDRFRARHIGYVFQNHHLLASLTALENVIMPMAFARLLPAAQRRRRALELLANVGLEAFSAYYPKRLSTGQRLRVAIARALANNPRVLLADEPTAALDETAANTVMNLLQATCQANDAILLVASHDPALVDRFDMIVDLHAGALHECEPA
jgi:ABC-type lipoprotein export system ATPase subunit